jgi:Immunity protein 26
LGYLEYDTDINTINRHILLPKTAKGKEEKLTIPRILKIKGCGIQFSGSFLGGNIHVYDNKRNLFFIRSFPEDGEMKDYQDIDNWISKYIAKVPPNYLGWLRDQLSQRRPKVKIEAGDIVAFRISKELFGFARILSNVFLDKKRNIAEKNKLDWFHPRSLIVAPYAFYADNVEIDVEVLLNKKTLPALCIFDLNVYRGEMPIIGHRPLSEKDKQIPLPEKPVTSITINYTKEDIESLMSTNEK